MKKTTTTKSAIIAIGLISLLLLVAGCAKNSEPIINNGNETQPNNLTGEIAGVDSIDSELNDPELQKTDSYINEINW